MRNFLMVLAVLIFGTTSAIANDGALGVWKSEPGETGGYIHVQITNCGEKLCGEIIDVVENDNDKIIGEDIILNMKI